MSDKWRRMVLRETAAIRSELQTRLQEQIEALELVLVGAASPDLAEAIRGQLELYREWRDKLGAIKDPPQ